MADQGLGAVRAPPGPPELSRTHQHTRPGAQSGQYTVVCSEPRVDLQDAPIGQLLPSFALALHPGRRDHDPVRRDPVPEPVVTFGLAVRLCPDGRRVPPGDRIQRVRGHQQAVEGGHRGALGDERRCPAEGLRHRPITQPGPHERAVALAVRIAHRRWAAAFLDERVQGRVRPCVPVVGEGDAVGQERVRVGGCQRHPRRRLADVQQGDVRGGPGHGRMERLAVRGPDRVLADGDRAVRAPMADAPAVVVLLGKGHERLQLGDEQLGEGCRGRGHDPQETTHQRTIRGSAPLGTLTWASPRGPWLRRSAPPGRP